MILEIYTIGILLDIWLGDPRWYPHPVRFIGKVISCLNRFLLKEDLSPKKKFINGILLVFFTLLPISIFVYLFANIATGSLLHFIINSYLFYAALSLKDLKDSTIKIYNALKTNDLKMARKYLSYVVGRDTVYLPEEEIVRGAVETIAEGFADGVVAPWFYFLIGGNLLTWIYKGINTLDSMVGYRFSPYTYYGRASARLDDMFNYIPSRIAAFSMLAYAILSKKDVKKGYHIFTRDRKNHPSPNGGNPESAMAGILGVRLGGVNYYRGHKSIRGFIGDPVKPLQKEMIKEAIKIIYGAGFILFILGGLFLWLLTLL